MTHDQALDYAVVHMSPIDWAFRKQDQQFIATEMSRRGHPVLFVENTGARLPALSDLPRVADRLRNWARGTVQDAAPVPPGVRVVSPLCIPGASFGVERRINKALLRAQLRRPIASLGSARRILWIGLPTWAALDIAGLISPVLTVYYCGDALTELPGLRRSIVDSEREVVRRANVVFAASAALMDHCRELGADPIPVPMSIDFEASRAARDGRTDVPPELRGLHGRLIGYMGGLNSKVDVGSLEAVCQRFPNDTLVVLGSVEDPRFQPRPSPNLVIVGERPYGRIAEYLVRFDVCLIPYRLTEFTAAVNPAKLLEYLAVGRPVVSMRLPEVVQFSEVIRIAEDREAFLGAIAEALSAGDDPAAREQRVRRAQANAYERVGTYVIDSMERSLRVTSSPAPTA